MSLFDTFSAFANRWNRTIHILQATLVLLAFTLGCALLATTPPPRPRSSTLILVYAIKSALFLTYQYLTTRAARFKRWASLKANFILDALDCLLWFTAFVVSCLGGARCGAGSCALLGVAATVALGLGAAYCVTAVGVGWPRWRAGRKVSVQSSV